MWYTAITSPWLALRSRILTGHDRGVAQAIEVIMALDEEQPRWRPGQRVFLRTPIGRMASGTIGTVVAVHQRIGALTVAVGGHETPIVVGIEEVDALPLPDDGPS